MPPRFRRRRIPLHQRCTCLHSTPHHTRCRQVGVNLGQPGGYLDTVAQATADIDIQVVFCNAGYVLTGFFVDV